MEHKHTWHQYKSLVNFHHEHVVTTNSNTKQFIFQFSVAGLIILLNCLILFPIIANRSRFWHSYFYCLLSTVISSILFAIIGMPVLVLFGQARTIILDEVGLCKAWHAISQLLWNASIFSIIHMNLDLIISLRRPNIYLRKSYELFTKIFLIFSWICSLIINIWLVWVSSLKIDILTPIQPCLHVAKLEHLEVSSIWGALLLLTTLALSYILVEDNTLPSPLIDNKLTCCALPLLLLDIFVVLLRVIPEVFRLILVLKPGIFLNSFDEKMVSGELNFVTQTCLLLLPIFWMFDPTIRGTVKMAFRHLVRSREHEEI